MLTKLWQKLTGRPKPLLTSLPREPEGCTHCAKLLKDNAYLLKQNLWFREVNLELREIIREKRRTGFRKLVIGYKAKSGLVVLGGQGPRSVA